jgi:hypothetical protein
VTRTSGAALRRAAESIGATNFDPRADTQEADPKAACDTARGPPNKYGPVAEFWEAHLDALFPRKTIAQVRCCSVALLEREAWAGTGIPIVRDGNRCLYRKRDVLDRLGLPLR